MNRRSLAACRTDPELMYDDGRVAEAKTTCAGCPLRAACLDRAVDTAEPWGVWGGFSPVERERLRAGHLVRVCGGCGLSHVPADPAADCSTCQPDPVPTVAAGKVSMAAHRDVIVSCALDRWAASEIAALVGGTKCGVLHALHRWGLGTRPQRVDLAPHGTPAAVRRHYRRKEPLCRACQQVQTAESARKQPARTERERAARLERQAA